MGWNHQPVEFCSVNNPNLFLKKIVLGCHRFPYPTTPVWTLDLEQGKIDEGINFGKQDFFWIITYMFNVYDMIWCDKYILLYICLKNTIFDFLKENVEVLIDSGWMSCLIFSCFWVVVVLPLVLLVVAPRYIAETGDSKNARRIRAGRKRWVGGGDDTSPKHSERWERTLHQISPKHAFFRNKRVLFP